MRYLIILLLIPFFAGAQSFRVSDDLKMEIWGTSTLHDWEMVSNDGQGTADFLLEGSELKDIRSLSFKMKTRTLKSGKGTMDRICYDAMKTDDHEWITFELSDITSITKTGSTYKITGKGDLTIAGKTNTAVMNVNAVYGGGKVKFTGEYNLKMTDFDVDPPTAMFGTIKTGDDLKVKFSLTYASASSF